MKLLVLQTFMVLFLLMGCTEKVAVVNEVPIAIISAESSVPTGTNVRLDGAQSYDPDSSDLSYVWNIDSKPESSNATISFPGPLHKVASNSFVPDINGNYEISLYVYDEVDTSEVSTVKIKSINFPPEFTWNTKWDGKSSWTSDSRVYANDTAELRWIVKDTNSDILEYSFGYFSSDNEFKTIPITVHTFPNTIPKTYSGKFIAPEAGFITTRLVASDKHEGYDTLYNNHHFFNRSVSILSPQNNETISNLEDSLLISVNVKSEWEVNSVTASIDSLQFALFPIGNGVFNGAFDLTNLSNGSYVLTVVSIDAQGNQNSMMHSLNIRTPNNAPTLKHLEPIPSVIASTKPSVVLKCEIIDEAPNTCTTFVTASISTGEYKSLISFVGSSMDTVLDISTLEPPSNRPFVTLTFIARDEEGLEVRTSKVCYIENTDAMSDYLMVNGIICDIL